MSKAFFYNSQKLNKHSLNGFLLNPYWYKYLYVDLFSKVGAHIGHTIKNTLHHLLE